MSRQVNWLTVRRWVLPLLDAVRSWPMAGTPEWCSLDDADPVKLAAIFDAAQHHALRVDTAQEHHAEASKAISAAADWPGIAREVRELDDARRRGVRIEREVSR